MLNKERATTPSLTNKGYFALRSTKLANAVAHSIVSTLASAACLFCGKSAILDASTVPFAIGFTPTTGVLVGFDDQSDLTTLTRTRVPSLLTGTESDLFTKASICDNPSPPGIGWFPGKRNANVLSTEGYCSVDDHSRTKDADLL